MVQMEYTVGSLADLITGSNTPNKPKVIKKKFKKDEVVSRPEIKKKIKSKDGPKKRPKQVLDESIIINKEKSKKKIKKGKGDESHTVSTTPASENKNDEPKKKSKKRKLDESQVDLADSGDEIPTKKPKRSENGENAERRVKKKLKEEKKVYDPEELARTLFVGNVPITTNKKEMKKLFKKYGPVESLRFRGIPVADPKTSKKVAAITKEFHPDRNTIYCYIRFENQKDAIKAEAENGAIFKEHHLRVHTCNSENKPDESKAIFVGNLCFDAEEEDLWKLFEPCGTITSVRIIRDSRTGMGKGFAYVNFQDSDAVQLALEMENVKLKNRELRIALSNLNTAKKNKKKGKGKLIGKTGKPNFHKQLKNNKWGQEKSNFRKPFNNNNKGSSEGDVSERPQKQQGFKETGFEGSKFTDKKKKFKVNKGAMEKKWKMKKIAPHAK